MTTSNTVSFTITQSDAIRAAFEHIGIIGEGDSISSYDYGVAQSKLNLMLKNWQNQAEHLWVRQKIILFLQASQPSYSISLTSTDHITADINTSTGLPLTTQLTAANVIGNTDITVTSSAGFVAGYYIGVQTTDGTLFWSTVNTVLSPTSVRLSDALTSATAIGGYVFGYQNKITTIFNPIKAIRRLISSNIDVPLLYQAYDEYLQMPNKFTTGTPNMWSYDRQIDQMIINIWQNPVDVSYYLIFAVDRKIQDMNVNSDSFDLPQEWGDAIITNLALALAPIYGKAQGENFQELKMQAKENLMMALENDDELGSIYIMPSRSGVRGRS